MSRKARFVSVEDLAAERKKISDADLVVFYFQPQLHTIPAMLKYWLEQVFGDDFAFDEKNGKVFHEGHLKVV